MGRARSGEVRHRGVVACGVGRKFFSRTILGESRDDAFSIASADADEPTAISAGQDGGSALEQLRAATDDGVADKHLGKRELRSIHCFPLTAGDRQPRITNAGPR